MWLLRDVIACFAVMLSFWPMAITMIATVRAAIRGRQSQARWQKVSLLLASAETMLDWAITRQAYRLLGWKPSQAKRQPIPPVETPDAIMERLGAYMHAFRTMTVCARAYADSFAARHNIPTPRAITRARTAHRPLSSSNAQRWGRWIAASSRRDGGGSRRRLRVAAPRAPPTLPRLSKSAPQPLRV